MVLGLWQKRGPQGPGPEWPEPSEPQNSTKTYWLGVSTYPSEKWWSEFVSWDDDMNPIYIYIWKVMKNVCLKPPTRFNIFLEGILVKWCPRHRQFLDLHWIPRPHSCWSFGWCPPYAPLTYLHPISQHPSATTLWWTNILLWNMAIEIVDFHKKMVIFHGKMWLFTRGYARWFPNMVLRLETLWPSVVTGWFFRIFDHEVAYTLWQFCGNLGSWFREIFSFYYHYITMGLVGYI